MIEEPQPAPLIVTALLPRDMAAWATALRTEHFPAERNYLDAHVTLFHALPPSCENEAVTQLSRLCADTRAVPARLEGIMALGRGTALKLASPPMLALRNRIAEHFAGSLTSQDQHRPRLHVTIQNKVSPAQAKALQAELVVEPRDFAFRGLALFRYRGGPWEPVHEWAFRGR